MIIHSPVISGSLTFAEGATFTLPDNGVYSGSFSGSIQTAGGSLTIDDTTFSSFSSSVSSSIGGISTDFADFSGNVTASAVSASGVISGSQIVADQAHIDGITFNVGTNNMVSIGTGSTDNPFGFGDQGLTINSSVGNTSGFLSFANQGTTKSTIYSYNGSFIIQPASGEDTIIYADGGNGGLVLDADGTASLDYHLLPTTNVAQDLGSPTLRWRDLYLSGTTMNLGGSKISSTPSGGLNFKNADDTPATVTAAQLVVSSSQGEVVLEVDSDTGGLKTTNTGGVTGSSANINPTDGTLPYRSGSDFGDSLLAQSATSIDIGGHFIPSTHNTYDLGSTTKYWRDLYLSSGSLYINGVQVLSTDGTDLTVQTDAGESLKLLETGNDTITLETANGDITLTSSGTGNIELDAPVQIAAGKNILSSDGNAISFANDINAGTNRIYSTNIGKLDGTSTVTGSFEGDGSGLTGLPTNLTLSGSSGNDVLSLLDDALSIVGTTNEVETTVTNNTVTIGLPNDVTIGNDLTVGNDLTITTNATILGNLTVQGTQTQLNTATLNIEDKNLLIASGAADSPAANGAGITIDGAGVTFNWDSTAGRMDLSSDLEITGGDLYVDTIHGVGGTDVAIDSSHTLSVAKDKFRIGTTAVTTTAAELNLLDTAVAGTIVNSKAVIYGAAGEVNATTLQIGGNSITATAAELNQLDDNTVGGTDAGDIVTIDGTQTLTNKTIAASQVTEISNLTATEGAQLENIGTTTISAAQWGYLGGLTATDTELNQLDGNTVGGTTAGDIVTIDGSQTLTNKTIAASQVTEISNLTAAEGAQLENIGTTTISATQWGYLGGMDQNVKTNSSVTFGSVSSTGDVVAYASSDERLKDNISNITEPINKLNEIRGVKWEWNDNADALQKQLPTVGVIAQEVEKVLPEIVNTRDNGYKAVDYSKLTALLIECVKEQQKEIEGLHTSLKSQNETNNELITNALSKINDLKDEIDQLKS